jgi:hypothetical protein
LVATLAVIQKIRAVRFGSAAQILEFCHLPKDALTIAERQRGSSGSSPPQSSSAEQQPDRTAVVDLARLPIL